MVAWYVWFWIVSLQQHWLKVDFGRWKDEDDSDVEEDGSFEDVSWVYVILLFILCWLVSQKWPFIYLYVFSLWKNIGFNFSNERCKT